MKKMALCILLFAVMLCGCEKKQTVGLCLRQGDAYLSQLLHGQLREVLEAEGYQVSTADARWDQAVQNTQIARLIKENTDVLIVEPVLTVQGGEIAASARQAELPVIFLNYPPDAAVLESWEPLSYVGCDSNQAGSLQRERMAALPGGGDISGDGVVSVLLVSGPEDHMDAAAWAETAGKSPGCRVLALEYGDWSRESGRQITARTLGRYGKKLDAVLCSGEEMTLGALDAIQSDGRTVGEDIYLLGLGANEALLEGVESGTITATVCPDVPQLAQHLAESVRRHCAGEPVENLRQIPLLTVTKENAAAFVHG